MPEESRPVACGIINALVMLGFSLWTTRSTLILVEVEDPYLNCTLLSSSFFRADVILGVDGLGAPVRPEDLGN